MRSLKKYRRFLADESGPTAVEYAIMLAMILMVVFAAVKSVGSATKGPFNNTSSSLSGS